MKVYAIETSKCNNCQKCVRSCAVKCIRVNEQHVSIMSNFCIDCGHCMDVCPQKCFHFESDIQKIKDFVSQGRTVVASLDPAYAGILIPVTTGQFVTALKKIGFAEVREAAEAAAYVTEEYNKIAQDMSYDNVITSFCPSVVSLIEKYYPETLPMLAPVVTPMVAHGRMMKRKYDGQVIVAYLSPCTAHRISADDEECVDGVISFPQVFEWIREAGIDMEALEETPLDNPDPLSNRLYAVSSGVIRCMSAQEHAVNRQTISINGVHNCREVLHSIKKGYVHNTFIEMHSCAGGCGNGACIEKTRGSSFRAGVLVDLQANRGRMETDGTLEPKDIARTFVSKKLREIEPSEERIAEMMKIIGNISGSVPLDCGACGYNTCRAKAISMIQGKSAKTMCLMYSFEKARSMSNLVMDNTPSIIMVLDDTLRIKEFNHTAEDVFKTSKNDATQMYLFDFIDASDYEDALAEKQSSLRQKRFWKDRGMVVLQTIIYIQETNSLLAIIEDVTEEEKARERFMDKKLETVRMAQEVVEKQMTTAQEIAGLLGETTAETKVILTKLKDFILMDEDDMTGEEGVDNEHLD